MAESARQRSRSRRGTSSGRLRRFGRLIYFVQRIVDIGIIGGALAVSVQAYGVPWSRRLAIAAAIAAVWFQLIAPALGLYRSWRGKPLRDEIASVALAWLCTVPALLFVAFISKTTEQFSRVTTVAWLVLAPLAMQFVRVVGRMLLRQTRAKGHNSRRVAIAGATELGAKLVRGIMGQPGSGNEIIGFYDDRMPARLATKLFREKPLVGGLEKLVEDARSGKIDVVHITLPLRAERRIKKIIAELADTTATVYVATDLFVFDLMQARWDSVGDVPVVSVFDTPFEGLGGWVKRMEDIVLSSVILLLIALPMLLIAVAIKLNSRGPVFFKQTRYGLNGQPIKVLKFRSMTTMDDGAQVVQAKKDDKRITKVGAFLRRTSLDELPQFINVLFGDMSVVGPRPHAVAHNEMYRGRIRGYMLRHKVKPGITGWAQVNGWRGETEVIEKMEHRVEHDLYYIDNWSLLWDLQIVFLTIFGRRVRSNAY